MKRVGVGIFGDHANLFRGVRDIAGNDARVDYAAMRHFASGYGEVVVAKLYAPWSLRNGENQFFLSVKEKGYEIVREPLRLNSDGSYCGNLDALMAYDIGQCVDLMEVVIIASGDGDFVPLLRRLRQKDKLVVIIGVDDASTNGDLRIEADEIYMVSELPELLEHASLCS
jgi:uncharacterized LabA/DUF88 family protein